MKKRRFIDWPKEIFKLPFLEKNLAKLTRDKAPGHLAARMPPLYTSYPKNSLRKATRNGINYLLDISDYMEWLVFFGIQVEPRQTLFNLVEEGDVVIDVGANVGEVTFNFAKLTGRTGTVHAFEPQPFVFSKLSHNLSLNAFTNIRLNNLALGEKSQEVFFAAQVESNRGGTRVQPNAGQGEKATVATLDHYVAGNGIDKLALIKIDVEGYELKVLRGARATLITFKPVLFIELNDHNLKDQGDSAAELIRFLNDIGYDTIRRADQGPPIDSTTDFSDCHYDIIAR